jgi:hypothetical protein
MLKSVKEVKYIIPLFLKGKSNSKSTAYIPMPKGRGFTPLFGK